MKEFLRKALTRKRGCIRYKPTERLLLAVQFSIYLLFALVAIEIAHLIILKSWNGEVFAAITGLAGTIFGVLLERKG
jgi:hypothetical protein